MQTVDCADCRPRRLRRLEIFLSYIIIFKFLLPWFSEGVFREGTFFLGGGRAGEFWYFFPKKVLALPCVLMKKLLTPPPLGD